MDNNTATEEKQHSMLSPSSSAMWLNCTPSAAMCQLVPKEDTVFTKNGTEAHTLAERKIRRALEGRIYENIAGDLETFDAEMDACTDEYVSYIVSLWNDALAQGFFPETYVETILDLSAFIPEGKGTADFIMIASDVLHVIDFKYGANIAVKADGNSQMRIYAAGAQNKFASVNGIFREIRMTIFQPRMGNVSTDTISGKDLQEWVDGCLVPRAKDASKGIGELKDGDWCTFCSAKVICKKKCEEKMKALIRLSAIMEDYKEQNEDLKNNRKMKTEVKETIRKNILTNDEIATVVKLGQGMESWLRDMNKYALARSLAGEQFNGLKLISSMTPSEIGEKAAAEISRLGFNPYKDPELKSKTAISKEMGKALFAKHIQDLLEPGEEKAKLADLDDKAEARPYTYFTPDGKKKTTASENTPAPADISTGTVSVDQTEKDPTVAS